jgi:hypothetical protein
MAFIEAVILNKFETHPVNWSGVMTPTFYPGVEKSKVFFIKGRPQNHSSRDARVTGVDNHHRSRNGNAKNPLRGSRRV